MQLREEIPADIEAIAALNDAAFGGAAESALVARLRADGDLSLSLVAEADGRILGHLALSPIGAAFRALALAPVAVAPGMQRQGIGSALVREAMRRHPDATLVVLGDPAFYARFGFRPVAWTSPYAGPYLQAAGPHMPDRARIIHAPAFSGLA